MQTSTHTETLKDIHGIYAPIDTSIDPKTWILLGILTALIVGLATWFTIYKIRKNKKPHPLSPYEKAIQKLSAAKSLGAEAPKEFAYQISSTLRIYIEEIMQIPVVGQTSEEFIHYIKAHQEFTEEDLRSIQSIFNTCERVQFTNETTSKEELQEAFLQTRELVETLSKPSTTETV